MSQTLPQRYGKYILLRRIAVGGMAEIFRAKAVGAEGFERDIAIKRILPNYTADESFVQMFKDEANIAAKLSHANIVTIFDFDEQGGTYYIAMEFIEGKDLKQMMDAGITAGKPPSPLHVTKIAIDTCGALHHAHTKDHRGQPLNIVHRDVSPHNIMVTFNGDVKLMDFGIAKARQRFTQTQAGLVKGKCAYMSPEQVRGKPLDGRSDVFALGVVMWEMLTRQRLFAGDTDYVTLSNVVKADVLPPREINPAVPEELDRIIMKSLERDRENRPDALAFQRELQRFYYTQAIDETESLADYMRDLFAADIKVTAAQQAEERNAFVGFMSQERHAARGPAYAPPRPVEPQEEAPRPAPSGFVAPPPAAAPPPPAPPGTSSRAAGTLAEHAPPGEAEARTVPIADMQRELQARLSASAAVPKAKGTGAIGFDPVEEDLPETIAMSAIPSSGAGVGRPGTPGPRPVSAGTGVAHEGADSSAVHPAGRRTGLIVAIVAIAVAVGVGAFFLVRSMTGGEAPRQPEQQPRELVAQTDVGTTVEPGEPGTEEPTPPAADVVAGKVEVPLHDARLTLSVVTIPADATLFVNDEKTDARKLEGIERGATVRLRAEKADYAPVEREVQASPDEPVVTLKLQPVAASGMDAWVTAEAPVNLSIDGRNVGQTPYKHTGQVGQVIRVEATADGYLPYSGTFTLDGKPVVLPLQKAAHLALTVTPPDATVTLNGARLEPVAGKPGTYDVRTLAVGTAVQIAAEAPNYKGDSKELTLGEQDRVELALRPRATTPPAEQKGTVWLNAKPWAEVFYKGQSKGRTPYEAQLPAGRHTFVLKKGDVEKSVTVTVKGNAKATKVVDMQN